VSRIRAYSGAIPFRNNYRNPVSCTRLEAAHRLLGCLFAASPAIGEVLSPLRPSRAAMRGDSSRRIWRRSSPLAQTSGSVFSFAFSNPVSIFRWFRAGFSRPHGRPGRFVPAGVEGPPRLRPSAGRSQRATRFAGYGRFKPIGLTSGYGCLSRCRIQVLVPKWLSTDCTGCLAGPSAGSLAIGEVLSPCWLGLASSQPCWWGDSLRRVWEMAFVAAFPPARVRPQI
jgi:hypothetical protein